MEQIMLINVDDAGNDTNNREYGNTQIRYERQLIPTWDDPLRSTVNDTLC